jgi:hypothetical protein
VPNAILEFYFLRTTEMKWDDLSLLQDEKMSDGKLEKLKIIMTFHDRLPTQALQEELVTLMEHQPFMVPGEFELRLDQFAAKVKAVTVPAQVSAYLAYATLAQVH